MRVKAAEDVVPDAGLRKIRGQRAPSEMLEVKLTPGSAPGRDTLVQAVPQEEPMLNILPAQSVR